MKGNVHGYFHILIPEGLYEEAQGMCMLGPFNSIVIGVGTDEEVRWLLFEERNQFYAIHATLYIDVHQ